MKDASSFRTRKSSFYDKKSNSPFKISRSKFFNFLSCKRCFYLDQKIIEIYKGMNNEFAQAVALNAAAGLVVSGKELDFKAAFEKALNHLKSGAVFEFLTKIQSK